MRFWLVVVSVAMVAAGCASSVQQAEVDDASSTTAPPTTSPTSSETTIEPAPPPTEPTPATPNPNCRRVIDFAAPAQDWFIVNDGVMGGLSEGTGEVANGVLSFRGFINTNGGGFSQVRTTVPAGTFEGASSLRIRFRTEYARTYEFIVDATADGLDSRLSYFGQIAPTDTPDFQEVEVSFVDFESRIFGTLVDAPAIDPTQVTGIGIMLSDGIDADFSLDVEWIDACE